ncbi:MAG: pitrilysin family protein [Caldicoprobacterales bacterium]|jgi:predicted Zn-dependent peptidase|nr:insulinase family protein [Clostridiales bacterium]
MYKRLELKNGIQVVVEKIPHFRSVAIGLWFKAGSVYESKNENGLSHFIEHMLFKGTKKRSAKDIAQTLEAVGGQLNAFTAKECTCFYSKVIDEHLELALELLSDMVLNSIFDERELDKEKGVVLEEISMYEDSPDDVVHELLHNKFYDAHPLGQSILGTAGNIKSFTREGLLEFFDKFYAPNNLVISVAGNFDNNRLISLLEKYFGNWDKPDSRLIRLETPQSNSGIFYKYKDIEQTHLCIGYPGLPIGHKSIYALMVFNNLFGGGMSSRLFQKIREDKGLAYSVYSYPSSYVHGGLFTIYAGIKSSQTAQVVSIIAQEIESVKNRNITKEEFYMAREQLKGNYILGLESTSSRMSSIGRNQLLLGRILTPDEVLTRIDNVTLDDIYDLFDHIFGKKQPVIALVSKDDLSEKIQGIF